MMAIAVKVRIRPRKVVVIRPATRIDVVLALSLSTIFVIVGLLAFTILFCQMGWDLGSVPRLRFLRNLPNNREAYLVVSGLAFVLARLMGAYAYRIKLHGLSADELSIES